MWAATLNRLDRWQGRREGRTIAAVATKMPKKEKKKERKRRKGKQRMENVNHRDYDTTSFSIRHIRIITIQVHSILFYYIHQARTSSGHFPHPKQRDNKPLYITILYNTLLYTHKNLDTDIFLPFVSSHRPLPRPERMWRKYIPCHCP